MNSILDTNNNPLTHVAASLSENGEWTFVVRVPCVSGTFLAAAQSEKATVLARLTGSGDPFIDIAATPLSLTPYADTTVNFDIKIVAANVAGVQHVAIPVKVTFNP